MNIFLKIVIFFLGIITGGCLAIVDHTGTEFLLTFCGDRFSKPYVLLSAHNDASVTFQNNFDASSTSHFVLGGTTVQVKLSAKLGCSKDLEVHKKSVYLRSSSSINVFVLDYNTKSSEGYHAIPISLLSTEYVAVSYQVRAYSDPWIRVAAVEDDTHINVNFRIADNGKCTLSELVNNQEQNFTLNRFEVVGKYCTGDLTGTFITSDKPITVFSGHACVKNVKFHGRCDKMEEMLPPSKVFGKSYVLHKPGRKTVAVFRILAKDNDTELNISNGINFAIDRGDFIDIEIKTTDNPLCLISSKPVMIVVIVKDRHSGICLFYVPSVDNFAAKTFVNYQFHLPTKEVKYFISVLIHQNYVSSLNASIIPQFVNIEVCDYAAATFQQMSDSFTIHGGNGISVGVMMYGIRYNEFVFGYPVGMTFEPPNSVSSIREISSSSEPLQPSTTSLNATSNHESTSMALTPTRIMSSTQQLEITPTFSSFDDIFSTIFSSEVFNSESETETMTSSTYLPFDYTFSTFFAFGSNLIQERTSLSTPPLTTQLETSISSDATTLAPSMTSSTSICRCSCRGKAIETKESASQYAREIKKNLTVDKTTLSKTILKKISVNDQRPSAQAVGAFGLLMLTIPAVFIVLPDIFSIFSHVYRAYNLFTTEKS